MARNQGRHFSIDAVRLDTLAGATGIQKERVASIALDQDWAEGEEHQQWLDTADTMEIGEWLLNITGTLSEERSLS